MYLETGRIEEALISGFLELDEDMYNGASFCALFFVEYLFILSSALIDTIAIESSSPLMPKLPIKNCSDLSEIEFLHSIDFNRNSLNRNSSNTSSVACCNLLVL